MSCVWWLGESQTLYNKSMKWLYVCVPELNVIPWTFKYISTTEGHGHAFLSFYNQWCVGVEFLSALVCEVLL